MSTERTFTFTGDPRTMGMEMGVEGYQMALEMTARIKQEYRQEAMENGMASHYVQMQFFARRLFAGILGDEAAAAEFLAGYEETNPGSAAHRAKLVKERLAAYGDKDSEVLGMSNGKMILVKKSDLDAAVRAMES